MPADLNTEGREKHQREICRRAGHGHQRRFSGMAPLPFRIERRAGPSEQGIAAGEQDRNNRHQNHSVGLALDVRQGIERHLTTARRRFVSLQLRRKRVRRFMTGGGKEKRDVPDKRVDNHFRRDVEHATPSALSANKQSRGTTTALQVAPICYQSSFNPNCTCRDVVVVLVITPAVLETPDGVNATSFGILKFARFSRLKISARNCRFSRSLSLVSLSVEKSQLASPGPRSVLRPRFP